MFGTATAFRNFAAKKLVDCREHKGALALVFGGAKHGRHRGRGDRSRCARLIIPLLLVAVALYLIVSPRMGDADAHQRVGPRGFAPVAGAIVAYDGFFGPGTGRFFTASPVGWRGLGLTRATALTKLLNLTSNVASSARGSSGRFSLPSRWRSPRGCCGPILPADRHFAPRHTAR